MLTYLLQHARVVYCRYEISVLQFMRSPADSQSGQIERDIEERRWIHRLATVVPQGLNLMD